MTLGSLLGSRWRQPTLLARIPKSCNLLRTTVEISYADEWISSYGPTFVGTSSPRAQRQTSLRQVTDAATLSKGTVACQGYKPNLAPAARSLCGYVTRRASLTGLTR